MSEPEAFEISVSDAALGDLRRRLAATRWPEQPAGEQGGGWDLGTDLSYARELCEHWRQSYDWRPTEEKLNGHENLRWEGLHCLRVGGGEGLPLVFVHGWPSGPLEYLRAAELLAGERTVIVSSLPGYGWSEDPGEPLNVAAVSARLRALVEEGLGIERYAVAGGDWGAIIAARIAFDSPRTVAALHVSSPATLPAPGDLSGLSEAELAFVENGTRWRRRDGHHLLIQSVAPDVLSPALTDSPAGLAAYLIEKYRNWSDCDGEIERRFSKDELCDFLTMFWATDTIASSMRLYWGERRDRWRLGPEERISVPAGASVWPGEIINPPRKWSERILSDLRRWTEMPSGGHFAAFEEPRAYVEDLGEFLAAI